MHGNVPLTGNALEKSELIEEEVFSILKAGEIPEVALHESLYHLTQAQDGPGMELEPEDMERLTDAVISCYRRIILRDLNPENRDRRSYRGLARCVVNVRRLLSFAARGGKEITGLDQEIAHALIGFLTRELDDVTNGRRKSSINCPYDELLWLVGALGISPDVFPHGIESLFPPSLSPEA